MWHWLTVHVSVGRLTPWSISQSFLHRSTLRSIFLPKLQHCSGTSFAISPRDLDWYYCSYYLTGADCQTDLFLLSSVLICLPLEFILLSLTCHQSILPLLLLDQSLLWWRRLRRLRFSAHRRCTITIPRHCVLNYRKTNTQHTLHAALWLTLTMPCHMLRNWKLKH